MNLDKIEPGTIFTIGETPTYPKLRTFTGWIIALLALSNLFWIGLSIRLWRKWNQVAVENDELRKFNMQQITKELEAEFDRMMLGIGFRRRDSEWPEEIGEK